jgi:uncharacterized repeat protein (TIGR01451 family)
MIQKFSWLNWIQTRLTNIPTGRTLTARRRRSRHGEVAPVAVECLEQRVLLAAVITVTNVDALGIDTDSDGVADPGDQIHYTVTVQNTGDASATGLTFQEIINDPNLTLVPNSINVSPLAINDTYTAVANTQLVVGNATPLSGPVATLAGNVLTNDMEFLGDSFTISTFDATCSQG